MSESEAPIITTPNGKLRGTIGRNIDGETFVKFFGIRYGKPPVGDLRFMPPQPVEPWEGVIDATQVGNSSLSRDELTLEVVGSEDCLFLNVYCKKIPASNSELKPVMVYIHGGGFMVGSSRPGLTGPEFLLTKDIVLVTLNYRLGILGFLSVNGTDVKGNMGLKDQNLALKWVQNNIKSFGGDPNNVTLFGLSAGSASVHAHILSPASKGLFHKAILQSGCCLNYWFYGQKNNAREILNKMGKDASSEKEAVQILKTVDASDILAAQEKISDMGNACEPRPFVAVIEEPGDNEFLTEDPREIIKKGTYNQVPMIIGYASMEGFLALFMVLAGVRKDIFDMETSIPHDFGLPLGSSELGEAARILKRAYNSNAQHHYDEISDSWFIAGISEAVLQHLKTAKNPIYFYRMSIVTKLNHLRQRMEVFGISERYSGASHADDWGYILKTDITPQINSGSVEEKYLKTFVELWTNFAKYGNPTPENCSLGVTWNPVERWDNLKVLDIGESLQMKEPPEKRRMDAWLNVCEKFTPPTKSCN